MEFIRRATAQSSAWITADKHIPIEDQMVDWIMKTSTSDGKYGIQWTACMQLDDLDLDDLSLPSYADKRMQVKTISVGLNGHKGKASSSNTTRRTPT
ncbi:unnamed protein product [Schistosoma mattheei]|uniref:Uncharacterized protein n=1 Tax=Schistosoma mattheei TaxID=31246 RepID=A0A183PL73_9TREM|nr:unnamed protein product [Schistosoma mattheei]